MRVHLEVSGGVGYFPGLAAPRTIDADNRRQTLNDPCAS